MTHALASRFLAGLAVITGGLVYWALRLQLVRPMQKLSTSIAAFSTAPEDLARAAAIASRRGSGSGGSPGEAPGAPLQKR